MDKKLNLRDLATLYVIAEHNIKEADRLDEGNFPREARPSLARPVDITLLWGNLREPEKGILNQYIIAHDLGPILRHSELVYRCTSRLQEAGLLYDKTTAIHTFAPTPAGLGLFAKLKQYGDPKAWPEQVFWSVGRSEWTKALFATWSNNT